MFLLLAFIFTLSAASHINAQGTGALFVVNDSGDSMDASPGDGICADANGRCTLRAAIVESYADTQQNAIIFDLPQPAVINLILGELSVIKSLEIVSPGARRLTVRRSTATGTPNFRIFHVPTGQTTLNIRGIAIRNGNDTLGGGLYVESGTTVGLYDVAVSGNHATAGGGIANFGTLSILRSLINSNVADNQGGAITNATSAPSLTITNSTLTDNSASFGGAIDNGGSLLLINDTISRNSASLGSSGVFNNPLGTVQVLNTIIGRDSSGGVPMIQGRFQSLGTNIVTDAHASTGFISGVNGDQISFDNSLDPLLGNLADNGGQTDTLASLAGSPAIGNANSCILNGRCPQLPLVFIHGSMDQRRYNRRGFTTTIDVGAFNQVDAFSVGLATIAFGIFPRGSVGRYTNSPVILTNARTLEKRYSLVKPVGTVSFTSVLTNDVYILEIKAKRSGVTSPQIFGFD